MVLFLIFHLPLTFHSYVILIDICRRFNIKWSKVFTRYASKLFIENKIWSFKEHHFSKKITNLIDHGKSWQDCLSYDVSKNMGFCDYWRSLDLLKILILTQSMIYRWNVYQPLTLTVSTIVSLANLIQHKYRRIRKTSLGELFPLKVVTKTKSSMQFSRRI